MKSAEEIIAELKKFSGSCVLYKHWLNIQYTQGIKHLAETTQSFWLIDTIASYQTRQLLSNPYLEELQIWRLVVQEKSGILICEWDTNKEVLRQDIPYTDFPLPTIKLYLAQKVLMLQARVLMSRIYSLERVVGSRKGCFIDAHCSLQ